MSWTLGMKWACTFIDGVRSEVLARDGGPSQVVLLVVLRDILLDVRRAVLLDAILFRYLCGITCCMTSFMLGFLVAVWRFTMNP